jgi:protein-disulfide isomerase
VTAVESTPIRPPLPIVLVMLCLSGCIEPAESPYIGDAEQYRAPVDETVAATRCASKAPSVFNNQNSPSRWGDESVEIAVDLVSDFRCPFCSDFALEVEELWERRDDFRASVRLYFHHFPIEISHSGTTELHVMAAAAGRQGDGYFWTLHDRLYARAAAGDGMSAGEARDLLEGQAGFDMERLETDMESDEVRDFVQWDKEQSRSAGAPGTPSVFVCGDYLRDRQKLESVIDNILGGRESSGP